MDLFNLYNADHHKYATVVSIPHSGTEVPSNIHKAMLPDVVLSNTDWFLIEDITTAVDIAKGSFYSFYKSREELLWEVIKHEEGQLVEQMKQVAAENLDTKSKTTKILKDLFLADTCIVNHLPQMDVEYIVRKMPPELVAADLDKGQEIVKTLLTLCGMAVTSESVEVIMMIESLQFVCSSEHL